MDTLIGLVVFGVIVWFCFWIIGKAFPAEIQVPAKVVVGVLALLVLFGALTGRVALPVFTR